MDQEGENAVLLTDILKGFTGFLQVTMLEKCPYSKFFWFVFSRIWTKYGEIFRISPYSVRIREIRTRKTANTNTFHAMLAISNIHASRVGILY